MNPVRRWEALHENLSDSNRNKIHSENRGLVILCNLFCRAKDFCKGLDESEISKTGGATLVVDTVYKRDPLLSVSLLFLNINH